MRFIWQKQKNLTSWNRAKGIQKAMKKDYVDLSQFHQIRLCSVEDKIFFLMVAHKLLVYLERNLFIYLYKDIHDFPCAWNIQPWAGIRSRLPKEMEKTSMWCFWILPMPLAKFPSLVFETITNPGLFSWGPAMCDDTRLNHNMAAFGSENHCRLKHLPTCLHNGIGSNYKIFMVGGCLIREDKVQFKASSHYNLNRWPDKIHYNEGIHQWLLRKLQENIKLSRMKIKPSKSRSISIIKKESCQSNIYKLAMNHIQGWARSPSIV